MLNIIVETIATVALENHHPLCNRSISTNQKVHIPLLSQCEPSMTHDFL